MKCASNKFLTATVVSPFLFDMFEIFGVVKTGSARKAK